MSVTARAEGKAGEIIKGAGAKMASRILTGIDPSEKNLLRIIKLLRGLSNDSGFLWALDKAEEKVNANDPALNFFTRFLREPDRRCRQKLLENFVARGIWMNKEKRDRVAAEGSYTPMTILISPTMRCNLRCEGCYAPTFSKENDLDYETVESVVRQGEEMGVGFFTFLGGEPLVMKDMMLEICRKFDKSYFQFFSNGTMIDENVAEEIRQVGNLFPIISIEGDKERTDTKRKFADPEKSVYEKLGHAMHALKQKGVPFGYSVDVRRDNAEYVSREEFVDSMVAHGAYVGWYFLHMPVEGKKDVENMPTPEQRKLLFDRWREMRVDAPLNNKGALFMKEKPLFIIDFWNDAPYVGGCIAGRSYIHVNHEGDVEPCIFTQFAVDNVKEKSLYEIMESEFFRKLRAEQPYSSNTFLPCMWLDNPDYAREICCKYGKPTYEGADVMARDPDVQQALNEYAEQVKDIYGPLEKEIQGLETRP